MFGDAVNFTNFLWLMAVLVVVVALGKVIELIYSSLGSGDRDPSGA